MGAAMLRKIAVATEFSDRCGLALHRARKIAESVNAQMVLIHVSKDGEAGRARLREIAEAAGCEGIPGSGDPAEFIVQTARREDADIVVVGEPVRRGVRDFLAGTTAEKVIRSSPVPVLMAVSDAADHYRKVMLATDFSEASKRAVMAFKRTGLAAGCPLQIVNIYDTPEVSLMVRAAAKSADIEKYIVEQGRISARKLAAFDAETGAGASNYVPRLAERSTGALICEIAQETGADLIVIGTKGKSGIRRLVLGSVAEEVLRLSRSDVLTVPVSD